MQIDDDAHDGHESFRICMKEVVPVADLRLQGSGLGLCTFLGASCLFR